MDSQIVYCERKPKPKKSRLDFISLSVPKKWSSISDVHTLSMS